MSAGNKLVNPQAQQSLPAGTPASQRRAQARLQIRYKDAATSTTQSQNLDSPPATKQQ
jgi:hypothetical protein